MPFLKLDCNWRAGWVGKMSEPAQIAWLCLLGYAKSLGHRGTVKAMDDEDYARTWGLSLAAVEEMFDAAIANNSVTESNGYVTVTNWSDYQTDPTNADRQAAHRAKKSAETVTNLPKNKRNQRNSYAPLPESNTLVTQVTQRGEERRREENNPPTPPENQNPAETKTPKGGVEPSALGNPAGPEASPEPPEIDRTAKGAPKIALSAPKVVKPWEAECRDPKPGELESWLAELKTAKGAA
jgi:hypothetical protein